MITRSKQQQEIVQNGSNGQSKGPDVLISEKTPVNQQDLVHSPQRQQFKHRHSLSNTSTKSTIEQKNEKLKTNRSSSFAFGSSNSWGRRRSRFLSQSMISNEKHMVYELNSYSSNSPRYSITLSESQGFNWNQDLFASQYQQKTAVIYDHYRYGDVFDEDDDLDMEYEPRTRAYSATNSGIEKVEVIDITIDE